MTQESTERPIEQEPPVEAKAAEPEQVETVEEVKPIQPIRGKDVLATTAQVITDAKNGILGPAYELGWRYLKGGEKAAKTFFENALRDTGKK